MAFYAGYAKSLINGTPIHQALRVHQHNINSGYIPPVMSKFIINFLAEYARHERTKSSGLVPVITTPIMKKEEVGYPSNRPVHPLFYILTGTQGIFFRSNDIFKTPHTLRYLQVDYKQTKKELKQYEEIIKYLKNKNYLAELQSDFSNIRNQLQALENSKEDRDYTKEKELRDKIGELKELIESFQALPLNDNNQKELLATYQSQEKAARNKTNSFEKPTRSPTTHNEKEINDIPPLSQDEQNTILRSPLRDKILEMYAEIRNISIVPLPVNIRESNSPITNDITPLQNGNMSILLTNTALINYVEEDTTIKDKLEAASREANRDPTNRRKAAERDRLLALLKEKPTRPGIKLRKEYDNLIDLIKRTNTSSHTDKELSQQFQAIKYRFSGIYKRYISSLEKATDNTSTFIIGTTNSAPNRGDSHNISDSSTA